MDKFLQKKKKKITENIWNITLPLFIDHIVNLWAFK